MELGRETRDRIWQMGRAMPDRDPTEWRKDECGAWMFYEHFGSEDSEFGWKIVNVVAGSPDLAENLRPFHRDNDFNRNTARAVCHVRADREMVMPTAAVGAPRNMAI
jgi:hypothetical protein